MLSDVFDQAIRSGTTYRNPTQGLERRKKTQKALRVPGRTEFIRLVANVRGGNHRTSGHAADLIEFLAYTGCRVSEARRFYWSDCDFEKGTLLFKGDPETGTKNWKIRTNPMIDEARSLMERIRSERPIRHPGSKIFLVSDVRGAFERASTELGTVQYSHHDLRHLFSTTVIESGVDIPTLSRWLGHSDGGKLAMDTYGHLRDAHSQDMARKVSFAAPDTV